MSLGYTLLAQAITSALEVAGLDPNLGYYHSEQYGRPALALDLMEEFRAVIVDSLVLSLISRQQLEIDDFYQDKEEDGIYLTPHGRRIFFREFSRRLNTSFKTEEIGWPLSYQKHFEVQATKIAKLIMDEEEDYSAFPYR